MSEPEVKDYFFKEVESTLIFQQDKFIKILNNKNFLPYSYTSYKINLDQQNKKILRIKRRYKFIMAL